MSRVVQRAKYVMVDTGLLQHRKKQAENHVVWIVVGKRLLQHFGKKGEGGGPRVINRLGQRRMENIERIEAHQLLAGLFRVVSADMSHGFERSAEAPPRPCR